VTVLYGSCVALHFSTIGVFVCTVGTGAIGVASCTTQVGVIGVFFSGISGSHF